MNYNNLIERLRAEALNKAAEATSALDMYLAIESLVTELSEDRYRHDRLQDFEVAQAQELARVKEALDAAIAGQETLQKELARVKAERDAAIEDWRGFCAKCAWNGKQRLSDGKMDARCETCRENAKCNWEWRGPQKEE